MLLIDLVEPIELPDHLIRFRRHILLPAAGPGVGLNRFEQILCAPVVQEKDSLPEAPQGRRAKFIARRRCPGSHRRPGPAPCYGASGRSTG